MEFEIYLCRSIWHKIHCFDQLSKKAPSPIITMTTFTFNYVLFVESQSMNISLKFFPSIVEQITGNDYTKFFFHHLQNLYQVTVSIQTRFTWRVYFIPHFLEVAYKKHVRWESEAKNYSTPKEIHVKNLFYDSAHSLKLRSNIVKYRTEESQNIQDEERKNY
jgi:hypothetical protein